MGKLFQALKLPSKKGPKVFYASAIHRLGGYFNTILSFLKKLSKTWTTEVWRVTSRMVTLYLWPVTRARPVNAGFCSAYV